MRFEVPVNDVVCMAVSQSFQHLFQVMARRDECKTYSNQRTKRLRTVQLLWNLQEVMEPELSDQINNQSDK